MISKNDSAILLTITAKRFNLSNERAKKHIDAAFSNANGKKPQSIKNYHGCWEFIVELNKMLAYSNPSREDLLNRADLVTPNSEVLNKPNVLNKPDILSCYDIETNTLDQIRLLARIASEERITNPVDRDVLNHRNMFFYGKESIQPGVLAEKYEVYPRCIIARTEKWERCTHSLMKQLLIFRDYLKSPLIEEDNKFVLMTNEEAKRINDLHGANFSAHFYMTLIKKQHIGNYTEFEINGKGSFEYLLLDRSLIKGKSEEKLISAICKKSGRLHINSTSVFGEFTQSPVLDLMKKYFHVDIEFRKNSVVFSRKKSDEYVREMQRIIGTKGMCEKKLRERMIAAGHKLEMYTIHRLAAHHTDLFLREGSQIYAIEQNEFTGEVPCVTE